jgi:hypothetical protein
MSEKVCSREMKYHRVVLRKAEMVSHRWVDLAGWPDLPVDFGWFDDLPASIRVIAGHYPDCRIVRHFSIRLDETGNGAISRVPPPGGWLREGESR